jgi:hypothetical protein
MRTDPHRSTSSIPPSLANLATNPPLARGARMSLAQAASMQRTGAQPQKRSPLATYAGGGLVP